MSWDKMLCEICRRRLRAGLVMCGPCGRSYDRDLAKDSSVAAAIRWTARRVRRFVKPVKEP